MLTARVLFVRCCRLDRWILPGRCRLHVLSLLLLAIVALPGSLPAQVKQTNEIIKFRLRDGYLIVVQTMVNGTGPYSFLLDTGTTRTVIDPDLALLLRAPAIGEASITTVLHVRQDKLVQLENLGMGEASVPGLAAVVDKLARQKLLAPGIRGVLGEDFLSRFDILIDYKKRLLRLGDSAPEGDRCRFETIGQYRGSPTTNRLLIGVDFADVSGGKLQLQLDTGAKTMELFPASQGSFPSQPWGVFMATSNGANGIVIHSDTTIKIGATMIRNLDVVQSRRSIAFDAVGLLPASIFHRIYISHSGGFIVLNPVE